MPRFLQSSIDEVLRRSDIVDIVSTYVNLKRNGTDFVGLCPFHREKTPSFHISADRQLYYCFGCGSGGNLVDFVMKAENLDFVDSIKFLADRAGVTLEEEVYSPEIQKKHDLRERILKMNKLSAKHFVSNLSKEDAEKARSYAKNRGLSREIITAYGIGFAPDSWSDLTSFLNEHGFKNDEIVAAGLAVKNEKGRVYDKFRNRLMFPIIDVRGNVIAFGGRALGEDAAKYMNSPETPVFHKGDNVFGLNVAKGYGLTDGLILVEGYMDAVSLHVHGFPNAVAGLGTALTDSQASLLKRYASVVYVCYDSDAAGTKAAEKAIDVLSASGVKIKVLSYSGAKDPDEFLRKKGVESFKEVISKALSPTEYRILNVRKNYNLVELSEKAEFLEKAAEILALNQNAVEREIYIKRISQETDISVESITAQVNKIIYNKNRKDYKTRERKIQREWQTQESKTNAVISREKAPPNAVYKSERMLLNLMFFNQNAYRIAKAEIEPHELSSEAHKTLFDAILKFREENSEVNAPLFLASLPDNLKSVAADVFYSQHIGDVALAVRDNIEKIKKENLNNLINKLASEGKIDEINDLIKKENERRNKVDGK
ncbi:MAG: DNA primase [Clostridia bacterium]|nr:DNA primase [Clostridia bacterium]